MKQKCPNCKKVINRALSEQSRREKFYPFCSNRCKLVDLGKWLDSEYRIATKPDEENNDAKTVDNPQKTADNNE